MATSLGSSRKNREAITSINITPLCDILLVLLIIFMVASTHIVARSLQVELPETKSSDGATPSVNQLTVARSGALSWNGERIAEGRLRRELLALAEAHVDAELVLSADEAVPHGRVVHFIDLAKQAGVRRFAINVEQARR